MPFEPVPATELRDGNVIKIRDGQAKIIETFKDLDRMPDNPKWLYVTGVFIKAKYMDGKYKGFCSEVTVKPDVIFKRVRLA